MGNIVYDFKREESEIVYDDYNGDLQYALEEWLNHDLVQHNFRTSCINVIKEMSGKYIVKIVSTYGDTDE